MELRMTVHVPRRRPHPVEVVVLARAAATVADLRAALGEHLEMAVHGLSVGGSTVPDTALLGIPPLLDGASVAVDGATRSRDAGGAGARPRPVLELVVTGGPDAGCRRPLEPPGFVVGRAPQDGLRLEDPSLSREHARLRVAAPGVTVEDLGSTNGVRLDGRPVEGTVAVDTSSLLVIGASTLRLRRSPGAGPPLTHPGDGTVRIVAREGPSPPAATTEVQAPRRPPSPPRPPVPWVAALAPVPVFALMALFLGPHLLAFALVGPLTVLVTALTDRRRGRRERAIAMAAYEDAVREARRRFEAAALAEGQDRHARFPDAAEVLDRAERRSSGLWSGADLRVRVGLADVRGRTRWLEDGVAEDAVLRGAPVIVDLGSDECLGVVGPEQLIEPLLASLVAQLLVSTPPSRLGVGRLREPPGGGPSHARSPSPWAWLDLAPHARSAGRTLLVVPDARRPGALDAVQTHVGSGGLALVGAPEVGLLPDACRTRLIPVGGGEWWLQAPDGVQAVVADGVGAAWRDRLGRALAPLREPDAAGGSLPTALGIGDLDPRLRTEQMVIERWQASSGPRALVGATALGPLVIDLVTDGPHVLVGGTTGSGKSEFLRTLVTGLALASPPHELTLLLVDFKGGAAFGPCTGLPHVVGVVTDLDARRADRALRSLDAELHRRESLLARVGAGDLDEYRRRPGVEPLPRLVVVVDELRTLVDELPGLVSGLVRLAAQGRSLGIHLVLATQRPSGTLTPEVQANVNLRIAFRVRDRADSIGVVESDRAASLPTDVPGRGVLRDGDGHTTEFQVALVRPADDDGPMVRVEARSPDGAVPCRRPDPTARAEEVAALVAVVCAAHRISGAEPPRRPWLPSLADRIPAADVEPGTVAVVDEPERQRRTLLRWDPAVPLWRLVGVSRSGRSTALRALGLAATRIVGAADLHLHVIAAGGDLEGWGALPHAGTVTRLEDHLAVRALVTHLGALVRARQAGGNDRPPTVLFVIDGWERLVDHDDPRAPVPLSEEILRIVRDGPGVGVVTAVSGGRDLLRTRWSLGGRTLLLGASDPLDAALLGLPSAALLDAPPPGRALLTDGAREVQVVDVLDLDLCAAATAPPVPVPVPAERAPWRYRPLPRAVTRAALEATAREPLTVRPAGPAPGRATGQPPGPDLLLGVGGDQPGPWFWERERDGARILICGRPRSGRTATLTAMARSAVDCGGLVVLVRAVASPLGQGREERPWPVLGPGDVDHLVALRRRHPALVVLVDDADLLDDAPVLPSLHEIADLVDRDGGRIAVATSSVGLRGRFRGLDVEVARHRSGLLLSPDPLDGDLLGFGRLPPPGEQPCGRGLWVSRGAATPVQVLSPPEPP